MRPLAIVLALFALAVPAMADSLPPDQSEEPIMGEVPAEPVLPSQNVKPYAPLPKELYESTVDLDAAAGKTSQTASSAATPAQKEADRIPGGPGECALEGNADGPTGCAILLQDTIQQGAP